MRLFQAALVLFLNVMVGIDACGVSVHEALIARILPLLPSRIAQHEDYIRAGAFYPDAFYGCMGQSDAAEEAHWPPFLAAGARLVAKKRAQGADASPLMAFLVGVLSHQVSDVSWHSLGLSDGLLRVMADREFDCDYDTAHSVLDVGGDMIYVHRRQVAGAEADDGPWDWSNADIMTILADLGYMITPSQINYCMARGRAALAAEKQVAAAGYKRYARQSPFLFDELEDYYVGGMTDMHDQTVECFPRLMEWFEAGAKVPASGWDICQVFEGEKPKWHQGAEGITVNTKVHAVVHKPHPWFSIAGVTELLRDYVQPKVAATASEMEADVLVSSHKQARLGDNAIWWPEISVNDESRPSTDSVAGRWVAAAPGIGAVHVYNSHDLSINTTIYGSTKLEGLYHAQFGRAMAVYPARDQSYLLVSSPGLSRIDVFSSNGTQKGGIIWPDAERRYGRQGDKTIGGSLAVDELLGTLWVGAPFADDHRLGNQSGAVWGLSASTVNRAIAGDLVEITSQPTLRGSGAYARLGTRLVATPRFVLVGSPGTSQVLGLDRITQRQILTLTDDNVKVPSEGRSGFGGYLLAGDANYIVIGAPLGDAETQNGQIYIYKNNRRRSVSGDSSEFAQRLGHSGCLRDGTIYVASPHAHDEQGTLWSVDADSGVRNELGSGMTPFAGAFGQIVATNGTDIAIGIPHYNEKGALAFAKINSLVASPAL